MPPQLQILQLEPHASDGDSSLWPDLSTSNMSRDDDCYLNAIGSRWARARGLNANNTQYRLANLPAGYACFRKPRLNDPSHKDPYLYGSTSGIFDSFVTFMPHFLHLMSNNSAVRCGCNRCKYGPRAKGRSKRATHQTTEREAPVAISNTSIQARRSSRSVKRGRIDTENTNLRSRTTNRRAAVVTHSDICNKNGRTSKAALPQGRLPKPMSSTINNDQAMYNELMVSLAALKTNEHICRDLNEGLPPTWYNTNKSTVRILQDWRQLPNYTPRIGELVLYPCGLNTSDTLHWHGHSWYHFEQETRSLEGQPIWFAGIIIHMPSRTATTLDLVGLTSGNEDEIAASLYHIEELPGRETRSSMHSRNIFAVPLHHVRPLTMWRDCVGDSTRDHWTPSLLRALNATNTCSSFSEFHFKGQRPFSSSRSATFYCRGMYLGGEFVMVGDTVKLLPRPNVQDSKLTEAMVITAIKVIIVEPQDSDHPVARSPSVAMHVTGRVFTCDPVRSFTGAGARPPVNAARLPQCLVGHGEWFPLTDVDNPRDQVEVPFTRVLGRYHEAEALQMWYGSRIENTAGTGSFVQDEYLERLLLSHLEAKRYSLENNKMIDRGSGKQWYWSDDRFDQLGLDRSDERGESL